MASVKEKEPTTVVASSRSFSVTGGGSLRPFDHQQAIALADYQRKVPTRPNSRGTVLEIVA